MVIPLSLSQCLVQQCLLNVVPAVFFRSCLGVEFIPSVQHTFVTELGVLHGQNSQTIQITGMTV